MMDQSIVDLNLKVDALSEQLAYLTEEARLQKQRRQEMDELKGDLTPIVSEVYNLSVQQLDEVESYVQLEDIIRLFKRLIRNTRNLEQMLDQFETLVELGQEVMPLSDDMFLTLMHRLDEMERKGYFAFMQAGMSLMDEVVTNFTEEDVRLLGENIVLILETLKEMTQPEIMRMLQDSASVMREEEVPEKVSMIYLVRQMGDPEVRRGLARTLNVLKTFSEN